MADLIKKETFERPSHPQEGPLYTIPLDLYRDKFVAAFFPALAQQMESFRAWPEPRRTVLHTDFPQSAPLNVVALGFVFDTTFWPGIESGTRSFMSDRQTDGIGPYQQDGNIGWLASVLLAHRIPNVIANRIHRRGRR